MATKVPVGRLSLIIAGLLAGRKAFTQSTVVCHIQNAKVTTSALPVHRTCRPWAELDGWQGGDGAQGGKGGRSLVHRSLADPLVSLVSFACVLLLRARQGCSGTFQSEDGRKICLLSPQHSLSFSSLGTVLQTTWDWSGSLFPGLVCREQGLGPSENRGQLLVFAGQGSGPVARVARAPFASGPDVRRPQKEDKEGAGWAGRPGYS